MESILDNEPIFEHFEICTVEAFLEAKVTPGIVLFLVIFFILQINELKHFIL